MSHNVDEPWKHAKWKKPEIKGPMLYSFIYKIFRIGKSILGMGDSFSDNDNVLELNRGDTTLWMPMNYIYFKGLVLYYVNFTAIFEKRI